MTNQPLLVGVTGGIGAGKSVVCKVFRHLGVPVYDADTRAKWLMVNDLGLVTSIKDAFGAKSYHDSGELNRQYLAEQAFNNSEELNKLNSLVHPQVRKDFAKWVRENEDEPYLIKEAALMIESGSYKKLDRLVVVIASRDVRIKRVLLRDTHRSHNDVLEIIDKQLTDEQFKEHADHEVNNNGDQLLLPKVLKLHEKFGVLAGQRG